MARNEIFLKPLTSKIRRRHHAVLDVESKSGECGTCGHFHYGGPCTHGMSGTQWRAESTRFDPKEGLVTVCEPIPIAPCTCMRWVRTQKKGFSRPFLIGFYDGEEYIDFDNDLMEEPPAADVLSEHCDSGALDLYRGLSRDEGLSVSPWQESHLIDGGCFRKLIEHIFRLDERREDRKKYQSEACHIYGHNAGRFDYLFLIPWLVRNGRTFKFEVATVQSKIQRLDVWLAGTDKKKEGYWSFFDSVSLLPMSLEEVGLKLCPPELQKKKEFDLDTDESDPRWKEYLRYDCLVLYEGLRRYYELVESLGGEVGVTSPATAMKLYRRKFQGKNWVRRNEHFSTCDGECHGCERYQCDGTCHGCAHDYVRRGYYGGRTELFKTHGVNIHYYDINSSYPASMQEDMPVGRMLETGPLTWEAMTRLRRTHIGFVKARVYVPESCDVPPLAYRHERLKKLVFPAGVFEGVWDFDELRLLSHPLVGGTIDRVYSSVWYEKKPIFKPMVDQIYPLRDKSLPDYNPALAEIAKLILNSFYGKWGMNEIRTGLVLVPRGEEGPENGWPMYGNFETDPVWEVERICKAAYIVPQIAAHVTALSRIRLFLGIVKVQELGGRVLYTDTDSIMCEWPDEKTACRFPTGTKLGEWKREDPGVLLDGEFILPKLYRLFAHENDCTDPSCEGCKNYFHAPDCKDKKRCPGCAVSKQRMKGVGSRGQTVANWNILRDGGSVEFSRVSQVRAILGQGLSVPEEIAAKKSLRTEYNKRHLFSDGTTKPLVLG